MISRIVQPFVRWNLQLTKTSQAKRASEGSQAAESSETRGFRERLRSTLSLILMAGLVVAAPAQGMAAIAQTFFVPMPEDQIRSIFLKLYTSTGPQFESIVSIVASSPGTIIYYDHWEDGYEVDIEHPVQPTTLVWGDNNPANGIPPGYGTDLLTTGSVVSLRNQVNLPRNPSILRFDGRDKFAVTKAVTVSRGAWATNPGSVLAGAINVPAVRDYGTSFVVPLGQYPASSYNSMFENVGLLVMASENGTTVRIDRDADGTEETIVALNQGESYVINTGVLTGATINSDHPIQVHVITGDVGANYESRWYAVRPLSRWGSSYYTPVGTAADGDQTYVFLFNPGNSPLTVSYENKINSGTFTVPPGDIYQYLMPQNSGAHFYTSGAPFYAVSTVGAKPSANNIHDWGFDLTPEGALTTQAVVGWGPGSSDLTQNGSPVWVTAVRPTTVYIDYDGDPATGPLIDPNNNRYDVALNLTAFDSQRVFDPDRDQTGMKLYTLDGTLIAAVWGQDPATAGAGNPFLDMGYTILPFPIPVITKSSRLLTDVNGNSLIDPGDAVQYTIRVNNTGIATLGNVIVVDPLPVELNYVALSTTFNGNPIGDDLTGATLFPLDETGYTIPVIPPDEFSELTYVVTVNPGASQVTNEVVAEGGVDPIETDHTITVNSGATPCTLSFTNAAGTPVSGYTPGQLIYVTVNDPDQNLNAGVAETVLVYVTNPSTGDVEPLTLLETSASSGTFRNVTGLPFSPSSGQSPGDGILYGTVGHSITADYTDSHFGGSCTQTRPLVQPTITKPLYLSTGQTLDREDPAHVSPPDLTTETTAVLGIGSGSVSVLSTTSGSGSTSSLVISHTTAVNANLMLVGIAVGGDQDTGSNLITTISGVTYGSQTMTLVGTVVDGTSSVRSAIYSLENPTPGTANVTVTLAASRPVVAGVTTFSGADTSNPLGTYASAGSTDPQPSTRPSVTVSSATGELVYDSVAIDADGNTPPVPTPGSGQTPLWNQTSTNRVRGQSSTKNASAPTTTMSWTWSGDNQQWAIGAVPIKPAPGGVATVTFTQSPVMSGALVLPAGGLVGVTTYVHVVSGTMPVNPSITAILKRNGTPFATLTNPTYGSGTLTWSTSLGSQVNISAGDTISLDITTAQSGVTFTIDYDSNTAPSHISLPVQAAITVASLDVYDAPYPGGNLVVGGLSGGTYYIRTTASDPFGPTDITSVDLSINGPVPVNVTLNDAYVVDYPTPTAKTYEYAWSTSTPGAYHITVIAHEGYEGTVADTAGTPFPVSELDTGTPSTTEFTTGPNGPHTGTYAPDEQVCVRVTDLDQNTDPLVVETITAVITATSGDSETITLTETGPNTGVFTACINASSTVNSNGVVYAPPGTQLTVTYVDPDDPSDTSNDHAIVPTATPSVAIMKTRVLPADGTALVGDTVRFSILVTNTGGSTLNTVSLTDTFPACLTYANATPVPTSVSPPTVTWSNVGPLGVGQSRTITITFTANSTCAPGVNSASAGGDATAGPSTANVTVTDPKLTLNKTLLTGSPADIGSTVTFQIDLTNTGSTPITYLPLSDQYSTCLSFASSVPPADGAGGGMAVWNDLSGGGLAPSATISVTVNFTVVGNCNPASNVASVEYATDINGDGVPPVSDQANVVTRAATISGQVRNDLDGDGDFNDPDPGIRNVTLHLYTDPNGDGDPSDGVLVAITTTDINGNYIFNGLDLGNYVVVETDPVTHYSTADTYGANDNRILVNVTAIQAYTGNDFLDSKVNSGTVTGRVYEDVNGNGVYDVGIDIPQADVSVVITDSHGNTSTVTTDSNGIFLQTVPAGNTTVDVQENTLTGISNPTLTTNVAGEGNDPTVVFVPVNGIGTDNTGYVPAASTGTVDGTVYIDTNNNGVYDPGTDTPLSGVTVKVTTSDNGVYYVVTDADGYFSQAVPSGSTIVDIDDNTLPANVTLAPGSTDPTTVTVPPNGVATDDTGYLLSQASGMVNGTIYRDNNGDGLFNGGDTPLPGVSVLITDSNGDTHTVITDSNGYFEWPVPAGVTIVDVVDSTLPPGLTLTTNVNGEGSDATTVIVPSNGSATDNTGYVPVSSVGRVEGVVYEDVDGDGLYTSGTDIPLPGVEVSITDANGAVHNVVTDSNGRYSEVVPAGTTVVDVVDSTLPNGATLTTDAHGQGNDPTTVVVPPNGTAFDNTGYVLPPTNGVVNGTIYIDRDNSGTFSAGDQVLPGVDVRITDSNGNIHTVTTDGSGFFQWSVPPGTTVVDVVDSTLPPGVVLTNNSQNEGSDPTTVTVPSGGTATDNTGYVRQPTGTVQGVVFIDTDGDGIYTPGTDTPLPGVEVEITASNGGVYTVITDGNGAFSQTVPSGATTVNVVDSTLPPVMGLAPGNTDPTTVTVPPNGIAYDNTGYRGVPTPTPTRTPTSSPTQTPTVTFTPTATPTPVPDLTIMKSHVGAFTSGSTGTYTLRVTNMGDGPTYDVITVSDTLPTGLTYVSGGGGGWSCSAAGQLVTCTYPGPLAPAAYTTFSLTVYVDDAAVPTVTNTATVWSTGDSNPRNNSDSDPTTVRRGNQPTRTFTPAMGGTPTRTFTPGGPGTPTPVPTSPAGAPDLTIAKSHTGAFTSGSTGTYTLTITNIGVGPTTGLITVTDPLPNGLTYVSGTGAGWTCSASGQTVTCTNPGPLARNASSSITLVVEVGSAAVPTVTNTASVSTPGDSNPRNNDATDPTTVRAGTAPTRTNTPLGGRTATPTLTYTPGGPGTPTPVPTSPAGAPDLTIAKSHTGAFTSGSTGTYTLTVTNIGVGPTTGLITVTDPLPNGLTYVSGAGAGWTCSASGQTVTCTNPGPLARNASSSITLVVEVGSAAVPTVTNTASVSTPGDSNPRNNDATDPTTVRAGTAPTRTNTPLGGRTATPTLTYTPGGPGTPTPVPTSPAGAPDLTIAKSHTGAFTSGSTGTYTLTVTNIGVGPTTGLITVTDPLPNGLTYVSGAGAGWTCSASGQTVTCTNPGPLARNASSSITLVVEVGSAAVPTVTNTASVSTPGDSNPRNNDATDPTTVRAGTAPTRTNTPLGGRTATPTLTYTPGGPGTPTQVPTSPAGAPDLTIAKSHTGAFTSGSTGTYTLTVTNIGVGPTTGLITVTDPLPNGLTYVSGTGAGWTCSASGQTVTCTNPGPLARNASSSITLVVEVGSAAVPTVTNTASVSTPGDSNPRNNNTTDPTTVKPGAATTPTPLRTATASATATQIVSLLGRIQGVVYTDYDADGVRDTGEPPIPGVVITLLDQSGRVIATTTTNSAGSYSFENLAPSSYTVVESDPAGYTSTTQNRVPTTVSGGTTSVVDYGDQPAGSISGVVFIDRNGDGIQGPDEPGLGGVEVRLFDASGGIVAITTTDNNGFYRFPGTPPGDYTVSQVQPNGYSSTTPNDVPVTVPVGGSGSANFGELPAGTITGVVYNDVDGNGQQGPREPGIGGVDLTLYDVNGTVIATTTTGPNGSYIFSGIPEGTYTVSETNPPNYNSTTPDDVSVVVPQGGSGTANFGDQRNGTISGVVFADLDGDGRRDPNEQPLAGVTVTLRDPNGNPIATTQTGSDGTYLFTNLPPGTYTVTETDPAGFNSTTPNSVSVTLPAGGSTSANFGDKPVGSVSGVVFDDINGNGIQDPNEPGIRNVTVQLLTPGGALVATTTTNADGSYQFLNVPAGNYTLRETDLPGFSSTTPNQLPITVVPSSPSTGNFGDRRVGRISGVLFNDADGDGLQGPREVGIGGVLMTLRDANGNIIASVRTKPDGSYSFDNVSPGNYTVTEADPMGFASTTPNSVNVTVSSDAPAAANFGDRRLTSLRTPVPTRTAGPPTATPGPFIDVALTQINENLYTCSNGTIRISVRNMGTGSREQTVGPIIVSDTLPSAFTYVSYSGDGWTCSNAGQAVTCTYPGILAPNQEVFVSIVVFVAEAAYPTINNIATVDTLYDGNPQNNRQNKPYTVYRGATRCDSATPPPVLTPGNPTPTPPQSTSTTNPTLQLLGSRTRQVGSAASLQARIRRMTGPATVEMELPEGLGLFTSVPPPSAVVGQRLIWEYPATSVPMSASISVRASIATTVSPGTTLNARVKVSSTGGSAEATWPILVKAAPARLVTRPLAVAISGGKTVNPGRPVIYRARVRNLTTGPGRLEVILPGELGNLARVSPAAHQQLGGRLVWENIPAPQTILTFQPVVDSQAVPGQLLQIRAVVTDGANNTAEHVFDATVR